MRRRSRAGWRVALQHEEENRPDDRESAHERRDHGGRVRGAQCLLGELAFEAVTAPKERFGGAGGEAIREAQDAKRGAEAFLDAEDDGAEGADYEIPTRRVQAESQRACARGLAAGAARAPVE